MTSKRKNNFWLLSCCLILQAVCKVLAKGSGKRKEEATLIFAGDITFDGPIKYFSEVEATCGYKRPFEKIKDSLKQADMRVANLESPLAESIKKLKSKFPGKGIHHYGSKKAIEGLVYAGFDVIQLANNHMADFGSDVLNSTVNVLKKAGVSHVGLSDKSNDNGKQKPLIKTINGIKIGILAYCWNYEGCNVIKCRPNEKCESNDSVYGIAPALFEKGTSLKDISELRHAVDIVIVLMHWGKELTVLPSVRVRKVAKEIKLAGATVIMGTHPHVIQGHECIGMETMVVYSLGNFLLPKAGSITKFFLAGRKLTKEHVKAYLSKMKTMFNLSQLAYIFKIKVNRRGVIAAKYLPIEIRNEEDTNCLQPVPIGEWMKFCSPVDLYCYDFRNFYAKSRLEFEEQSLDLAAPKDFCTKN